MKDVVHRSGWFLLVLAVVAGCGDDGAPPQGTSSGGGRPGGDASGGTSSGSDGAITEDELLRTWELEILTLTGEGGTTDYVAVGATLTLTLHADGTTTGSFSSPENDPSDPGPVEGDLAGTFSFDAEAGEVTLTNGSDTFLEGLTLQVMRVDGDPKLVAEEVFGDTTLYVVLA